MRHWRWLEFCCITIGMLFCFLTLKHLRWSIDLRSEQSQQQFLQISTVFEQMRRDIDEHEPSKELHIYAFSSRNGIHQRKKNAYSKHVLDMIEGLDFSFVHTHFIDFDEERRSAEQLNVKEYGKWVLQWGNRRMELSEHEIYRSSKENVDFIGMTPIAKKLRILSQKRQYQIGFLTGHGETSTSDTTVEGLSEWKTALEQNGFQCSEISFSTSSSLGDIDVLVITAPKLPLSSIESQIVYDHFETGGNIIYFDEPKIPSPNFIEDIGLQKQEGIATDVNSLFPYWDRPMVQLQPHPITKDFMDQRIQIVFSQPTAVERISNRHSSKTILSLSSSGWMERGGDTNQGTPVFDKNIDIRGKHVLGEVIEHGNGGKVLWLGDIDFIKNGFVVDYPIHLSFLLTSIHYLIDEDIHVNTHQNASAMKTIQMTHDDFFVFRMFSLGFLPLLIGFLGLFQYFRRRGR